MIASSYDLRRSLRLQVQSTPRKWTEGLRKFLTADAVAASNSIEGFKVSTVDVEDVLEGERDVDVSEEDREETLAYQRMMIYIQTLCCRGTDTTRGSRPGSGGQVRCT